VDELKFGIFDWIDRNNRLNLTETYEQRLKMLELADEAGIWCYHMAEHHGTPLAVAPAPNLFLAAVAERTSRLRFGPLVQLLPLNNPLRNIEEICLLDNLSGGRLELGIGRGISPDELAIYGQTSDEARERFDECFEIMLQGLQTGYVTYDGKYYHLDNAPVTVEPYQRPYPPLWYPTSNPERIDWVAGQGFNTLFGFVRTAMDIIAAGVIRYREAWAAHKDDAKRLNGHVSQPLYGATRHVFVADNAEKAEEAAREAYNEFDNSFLTRPGGRLAEGSRRGNYDIAVEWGGIFAGTPDMVRDKVQAFIDATGANYFVGTFAFGNLTTDQVLRSMRLFADEVMPNVKPAPSLV
jgi:alkanesulfonate monooxygenase SsuD/methylene tetrahydromethanopterin reductase-like flavin-dependent oxidoreductase (luciferase family)